MKSAFSTLSLMVTYQCNVTCRHCGPLCGPHEKDWMTPDEIQRLVTEADALGAHVVVYTGGEPTLLKEELAESIRFVKSNTRMSTRIVTNGKWATSRKTAARFLTNLKDAGLDEVNISCGEYHQQVIPFDAVVFAYEEACRLSFKTVLLAGEFLDAKYGKESVAKFRSSLPGLLLLDERSPYSSRCHGMSVGYVQPYGRGDELPKSELKLFPERELRSICNDVLAVITAHPNGKVSGCCGVMTRDDSPLDIGNWRQEPLAAAVARARADLLLNWIRYLGLKDLKGWLATKDPSFAAGDEYGSACDLCASLLSRDKARELINEHGHERAGAIAVNKVALEAAVHQGNFSYGRSLSHANHPE